MLDEKRVINEVAARNGIRIDADDPFFASATMVQLALEETLQIVEERFKTTIAEFESHIRRAERSAGKAVAQEAKMWANKLREGLRKDITAAGLKTRVLLQEVHEAHERPRRIFWTAVGLLSALGLFCSGIWFGHLTYFR